MLVANIVFYVTVLLLVYFCDQFVALEIRHNRRRSSGFNIQHGIQQREQDFFIKAHKYTQNTVTRVKELKSVHLKCNLFAFSSTYAEYLQNKEFCISRGCVANVPKVR